MGQPLEQRAGKGGLDSAGSRRAAHRSGIRKRGFLTLLDLGCGIGRHYLFLASQGFRVFGADASLNARELTKNAALESSSSH